MPKTPDTCLLILTVLLSASAAFAQSKKTDSLLSLLSTANDTTKVNLLNQISSSYWYEDPVKTFEYAKQAAELGEKIDFKKGVATAYNNTGVGYYQQNNYDSALLWYEKARAKHKEAGNFKGEAYILNNTGLIYWKQGEMPTAVEYYMKALKIWETTLGPVGCMDPDDIAASELIVVWGCDVKAVNVHLWQKMEQ